MNFRKLILGVAALYLGFSVSAQDAKISQSISNLPNIPEAAIIDGVLDEPQWKQALQFDLIYEKKPR